MNGPILTSRSFMPSIMILTILLILCFPLFLHLRARAEINSHFGASAGRADARRRDEGDVGHRRGAATTPISALRRRAPAGCGPQARWLCCSLLTYRPGYSSSLAPRQRAWGLQQNVKLFLREP